MTNDEGAKPMDSLSQLESLHHRRGQDLYAFARHLGLDGEEAADAVQETMLRLWRELSRGKNVVEVDGWSFRTIYRLAADQHRRVTRTGQLAQRIGRQATVVEAVDPSSLATELWQLVDELPRQQRAVLYLRYRIDLPFNQIGELLGISASGARSHASQALDSLRKTFRAEDQA